MKRLFSIVLGLLISIVSFAQTDITKFLGIPVAGTKTAMIQKLKAKGFTYHSATGELTGVFNGADVYLSVVTCNHKVWRILVTERYSSDEANIKIKFNNLVRQFNDNTKYISVNDNIIPDAESISYNMLVSKKRYEATFYQKPVMDSAAIVREIQKTILKKYDKSTLDALTTEEKTKIIQDYLSKFISMKLVWFMISGDELDRYRIMIYYDNMYNYPNGEDL